MSKKNKATALPSQTAHGKSEKSTNVIDPDLEIYKILFENLHDEVHLWKLIKGKNRKILNWQLVDANPAALNGWKKQKEEVVGRNPDEIFGEGTSAQFLPIVERIFKTGQPEHWVEYFEPTNQFLKMTSIPMGNFFISTGKDITQEKLTENALKESRGLLQQTESISNQGSWKYDIQEDRWSFSENWLRIFGFEKAPSSAQLSEIVDPRDSEIVIEMFSKAIKGEASYALEHRIKSAGIVRWVKVSAILHRTPEGDPHHLIGATRDITEEKQARDSLKENTELLSTAEKMANQGSWKWDIKNDKWTFSENLFQLQIGFRKPGLGREDLMKLAYPDDIPKINEAFTKALSGEAPYNLEHRFIKEDTGEVRWARASGKVIFSSDGEPEYMIGIGQDISEEKRAKRDLLESEEFLNRTGEIAKVGGWRLDVQSGRAHFTQVTYDIHELPYDHQISLDEAIYFYPPEERERVRAHVDKAIHQGIPYSFEARFITAKGNKKWVLSKAEPEMVDGKCVRLSGIFQDITERKNAERELERSEQKFKSVFQNAAVAHVLANAEGRYIDANEKACELFGYERDE